MSKHTSLAASFTLLLLFACDTGSYRSPTSPSLAPADDNVVGAWAGSYAPEPFECGSAVGPAWATFDQSGTRVSGTLNAAPPDCGFSNAAMTGTLVGNRLEGTAQIFSDARLEGTLSGGSLTITVLNRFNTVQGVFALQRSG